MRLKSLFTRLLLIYRFYGVIIATMDRDLHTDLQAWKIAKNRKPLILQGARQVGKTHLLKVFGEHEFANFIYLNFEEDPELKKFFLHSLDPVKIIEKIGIYKEFEIKPHKTLVIFDEIQECPEALNSLKYFCESAKELHVIAAGSLLGVKMIHTKGFPVGKVDFLHLYPLSFFEFLSAIDKQKLRIYLEKLSIIEPLPEPFHYELLELLKKYMYIGGMPEAVSAYVQSGNLLEIRKIHNAILKAYDLDFAKHAPKEDIMKIMQVWNSIPRQLAKEHKKFVFSLVKESARGREYESAIQWLCEAGLILKSYNLSTPKLPLPAYGDTNAFKIFMLDIGLLAAMCDLSVSTIVNNNNLFSEFNGAFTENFVAQSLARKQRTLYYWTSGGTAEVDFIIEQDGKIYPLEVKAGASRRKKSIQVYEKRYEPELVLRSSTLNLKHDGKLCNLPLYLISKFTLCLKAGYPPQL